MTGIIDVGGGMRGIFGCGVTDFLLDNDIEFKYCLGVSAGSANLASYIAGQRGRNYRFYTKYSKRPEYMSLYNFAKKRSFFDLDYVYSTLSNSDGEDPIDFDRIENTDKRFITVATRGSDCKPHYFTREDFRRDDLSPLKASCAIPGVCTPCRIDNEDYFDGGVADPIPVRKALEDGCDKVLLVLTKPVDFVKRPEYFKPIYSRVLKDYPAIVEGLHNRHNAYNNGVADALQLQKEGKVTIIAPKDGYMVTAFTRLEPELRHLYDEGYKTAQSVLQEFKF